MWPDVPHCSAPRHLNKNEILKYSSSNHTHCYAYSQVFDHAQHPPFWALLKIMSLILGEMSSLDNLPPTVGDEQFGNLMIVNSLDCAL